MPSLINKIIINTTSLNNSLYTPTCYTKPLFSFLPYAMYVYNSTILLFSILLNFFNNYMVEDNIVLGTTIILMNHLFILFLLNNKLYVIIYTK
jgi:hypothetical protein